MPTPSKMYLTKRNNGIYYVGYFDEGRKRWKSTGCTFKGDALKKVQDFKNLFAEKQPTKTFRQFSEEFLTYAKSVFAYRTWLIYNGALTNFNELAGGVLLKSLTLQHLDHYKTQRLNSISEVTKKSVSPVTVNIELRTLKACLNNAVKWKLLESNPFAKMQSLRVPETPPTYFRKSDFQKLLNLIREEWLREMIVFAVLTGMRRGEIINLRWQDVDLQKKSSTFKAILHSRQSRGKKELFR